MELAPDCNTDKDIAIIQEFFPALSHLRLCGKGTYGAVYTAQDSILGRRIAVKCVHCPPGSPAEREWHGLQAYVRQRLSHQNLLTIHAAAKNPVTQYFCYTMELADNCADSTDDYLPDTLELRLNRNGAIPYNELLRIALALLDGIDALHRAQLVHRDIKPGNVIFIHGVPKIGDMGLVTNMTPEISLAGTPQYMMPEQLNHTGSLNGASDGIDADLYALGKTIYCMMTGNRAKDFPALPAGLLSRHPELRKINKLVTAAASNDPRQRFHTASDFRHSLLQLIPVATAHYYGSALRRWWPLALGATLFLAACWMFFFHQRPTAPPHAPDLARLPWDSSISPTKSQLPKRDRLLLQSPELAPPPWRISSEDELLPVAQLPPNEDGERTLAITNQELLLTPPFEIFFIAQGQLSECTVTYILTPVTPESHHEFRVSYRLTPSGVTSANAPLPASVEWLLGDDESRTPRSLAWGLRFLCDNDTISCTANGMNFPGNVLTLPPNAAPPWRLTITLSAPAGEAPASLRRLVLFYK